MLLCIVRVCVELVVQNICSESHSGPSIRTSPNLLTTPLTKMRRSTPTTAVFLLLVCLLPSVAPRVPFIGVTYSRTYRRTTIPGLPSHERIVSGLRSAGVANVLLPSPNPETIRAFLYSGISLLLSLPNSIVPDFASNRSSARRWLADNVLPFHPRAHIDTLSVGSGLLSNDSSSHDLLPAIQNLHSACLDLGLPKIPISTIHSFEILDPAFPPSAARFRDSLSEPHIKPLLNTLSSTGAPFLIDLYPYELYRNDGGIPIGYAMFEEEPFSHREDPGTGLRYRNLFDSMVDAVIGAMTAMGHGNLPVVVTGTGWPSGDEDEKENVVMVEMARRYNGGLVKHLRSGPGTPMRRDPVDGVYIYELLDEKKGREPGKRWGIWYANLSAKYEIAFSGSAEIPLIMASQTISKPPKLRNHCVHNTEVVPNGMVGSTSMR